ncbi:MAG: ntpE [Evtepia sp.]|jgi:V/A-type H+-transporting ATPase subunit E|nr:ntpE [Evtepia sp.]
MNGIEKILGRIDAEAQAEIDSVLEASMQEAQAITARYEERAQNEEASLLEKGRNHAKERADRLGSVAQMEAKRVILSAKQGMLDKAFALAHEKLTKLPEEDYINLLSNLAVGASLSGKESLVFSRQTHETMGGKITEAANEKLRKSGKSANLTMAEETREFGGGLILLDGKIEVNCSFDTLLRLSREEMAGEIAAVLFP